MNASMHASKQGSLHFSLIFSSMFPNGSLFRTKARIVNKVKLFFGSHGATAILFLILFTPCQEVVVIEASNTTLANMML